MSFIQTTKSHMPIVINLRTDSPIMCECYYSLAECLWGRMTCNGHWPLSAKWHLAMYANYRSNPARTIWTAALSDRHRHAFDGNNVITRCQFLTLRLGGNAPIASCMLTSCGEAKSLCIAFQDQTPTINCIKVSGFLAATCVSAQAQYVCCWRCAILTARPHHDKHAWYWRRAIVM